MAYDSVPEDQHRLKISLGPILIASSNALSGACADMAVMSSSANVSQPSLSAMAM